MDSDALRNASVVEPTRAAGSDGRSAVSTVSVKRRLLSRMGARLDRGAALDVRTLRNATLVNPVAATSPRGKPAVSLTPLTRQGVLLVKWVLVLLGLSAAAVLLLTVWEDSHGPAALLSAVADALQKQVAMLPSSSGDGGSVAAMQKLIDSEKSLLDSNCSPHPGERLAG